jgi:uncharacterized protein (TIGR00251 family)
MEPASIIDITVSPKSSRSMITIGAQDQIKVYLNAPPADGKANAELLSLLSKRLKIPKSNMEIISGEKGKKKRLAVYGLSIIEITDLLKKS